MLQFIIGACLAAMIAVHGFSGTGARWLVRHFRISNRQRVMIAMTAVIIGAANVACLVINPAPMVCSVVMGASLVFLAITAILPYRTASVSAEAGVGGKTVLAVGAHPDDLELACGGTLAKLADAGYQVHALILSQGQVGGDKSLRPSEARAGANYLGLSSIEILDLPDAFLSQHNMEIVDAIEAQIRTINPELIFTHSEHDHHQDHHAVHLATLRAARRHSSILCFESPSTTRGFNPSIFVDIKAYVGIKIEAVQLHRDQAGKPYMGAAQVRGIASFRGSQAKQEYAEGFEAVRLLTASSGVSL